VFLKLSQSLAISKADYQSNIPSYRDPQDNFSHHSVCVFFNEHFHRKRSSPPKSRGLWDLHHWFWQQLQSDKWEYLISPGMLLNAKGIIQHYPRCLQWFSCTSSPLYQAGCKKGIPNVSPMLKEKAGGKSRRVSQEGEYSISFLHSQHGTIILKKCESSCTAGKTEYLLMVSLSYGTRLTVRKDFCSIVVCI